MCPRAATGLGGLVLEALTTFEVMLRDLLGALGWPNAARNTCSSFDCGESCSKGIGDCCVVIKLWSVPLSSFALKKEVCCVCRVKGVVVDIAENVEG